MTADLSVTLGLKGTAIKTLSTRVSSSENSTTAASALSRFRSNFLIWLILLVPVLCLQWYDHAFLGEFGGYPDEPAHYVTGLMFHDYFASLHYFSPLQFAENYYVHYPKVGIGHWPPVFYLLQAFWTLIFSTSHASLMVLMAALSALLALTLYRMLRDTLGRPISLAAAFVLLAIPAVQTQAGMLMADIPVALFCLLATWSFARFLDTERSADVLRFGAFSALAIMTKGSAFALVLVPLIAIPLSRKWNLWRRPAPWASAAIVLVICGPWYWLTRRMLSGSWEPDHSGWSSIALFYLKHTFGMLGWGLAILALVGILVVCREFLRSPKVNGLWASLIGLAAGLFILLVTIPTGLDDRYLSPVIPVAVAFAALGASYIASKLPAKWPSAPASVALLVLCFVFTGLRFPRAVSHGYGAVAQMLVSDPLLDHSVILVSSDVIGEGMLISQIAMRDRRPGHIVLRANEVLARSDWNGANYRLFFSAPQELERYLESIPVRAVVISLATPDAPLQPHQALLSQTLAADAANWKLQGTYPSWRKGVEYPDSLQVYLLRGHFGGGSLIHIDMRRMLGRVFTLRPETPPAALQ
ncbi:MAG: glycosyltransferase family 39 protein [Candidatus Acidiferrales bacterium]